MIEPVHRLLVSLLILICCYGSQGAGQERPSNVFRVNANVVLVDVSVKDPTSNAPVRDLRPDTFKVFDDGHPRAIAHFSREGDTRRPLCLLLFMDLWTMYGRKYLTQPTAMLRLAEIDLAWRPTEIAGTIMKQNDARSHTQFVVVGLIDDLFAFKRGEREQVGEMGARASVTFYGLPRYVLGLSLDDRVQGAGRTQVRARRSYYLPPSKTALPWS